MQNKYENNNGWAIIGLGENCQLRRKMPPTFGAKYFSEKKIVLWIEIQAEKLEIRSEAPQRSSIMEIPSVLEFVYTQTNELA